MYRSRWWGFVLLGANMVFALALVVAWKTGLAWPWAVGLLVLQFILAGQACWAWYKTQSVHLQWTGQTWQVDGAGLQYVAVDGDWQRLLLLRAVFATGRWRWLVLQADGYSPEQWHSLRCTLILNQNHA